MRWIKTVSQHCIECTLCQKECLFLQRHGVPKGIANLFDSANQAHQTMAFECSLCGLCAAVCPVGLDPSGMFLEMRREIITCGGGTHPKHTTILNYERRGTSRRYTFYALPEGCDTILFPGCTLPGTRPQRVLDLFGHLRKSVPALGIVLDCCTKPSHDLGRQKHFEAVFGEMRLYLLEKGVRKILVACPSCHQVFKDYGGDLAVKTVYELLAENGLPNNARSTGIVTVHDPCAMRSESPVHSAVRSLIARTGLTIEEMEHSRDTTLCCGEGGSARFLSPPFAEAWRSRKEKEARGNLVATYCAGCAAFLNEATPTCHILDLLFEPEAALTGKAKSSRTPFTYWNRLRLKARLKRLFSKAAVTSERTWRDRA